MLPSKLDATKSPRKSSEMPFLRFACAAFGVFLTSSLLAVPLAAERTTALQAEVNVFFNRYNSWFSAGRPDLIAEKIYLAPCVNVSDVIGPVVLTTREQVQKRFEDYQKPLFADGYVRSEWTSRNVMILHERAAIVSGTYTRFRKDGSVIGEYAGTYFLAKAEGGWRILSWTAHDAAAVVRASN